MKIYKETKFWIEKPNILYNNLYRIIPLEKMSFIERLNAISRFIIYYFLILTLLNQNIKYLYYSIFPLFIVASLWYYWTFIKYKGGKKSKLNSEKKKSTKDNPFMNITLDEITNNNNNTEADLNEYNNGNVYNNCNYNNYTNINDIYDKGNVCNRFYTTAVTKIPNDQTAFAEWCYKRPSCKAGDKEECVRNIERYNLR